MLACCSAIEPSVCVKIIWQFAWIFSQASSKPFFTACQNVLDGEEWIVKAMFERRVLRVGARPPAERQAALRRPPVVVLVMSVPPLLQFLFEGRYPAPHSSAETRMVAVNFLSMSGTSSSPRPGPGRHGDVAVLDRRQRGHQVAIPGPVIGAHALLDERVRRVQRKMRRGAEHDRAGAVVRRDRQVPGLGHRGDLARLREAAAPGDVEHHDAGRVRSPGDRGRPSACRASPRRRSAPARPRRSA